MLSQGSLRHEIRKGRSVVLQPAFVHVDMSHFRRVLVAGDVHGSFHLLEEQLAALQYNPASDALVLLGDLIDRGINSNAALEWIDKPNVFRVRGNHEEIAAMVADGTADKKWALKSGASWLYEHEPDDRKRIAVRLNDAPCALQVRTPGGRDVGMTHADCPSEWAWVREVLEQPEHPQHAAMINHCIWRRSVIQGLLENAQATNGKPRFRAQVTGVDHLFHGHTIIAQPFAHDDRSWIDTGAVARDKLTVVDVDAWLDRIDERKIFQ